MSDNIKNDGPSANGWAAVPRNFTKSLADVDKNKQAEMTVSEANPPTTDIAKKTHDFAKEQLPEKTFNHSMRVWYYGKRLSHKWTHARHLELDILCLKQEVAYIVITGLADSA
jgi:cyanamide hydratase